MLSPRLIKRQITSTKNTAKITKAMQMVAAAKMRKSQEAAVGAKPYAEAALRLLANISRSTQEKKDYALMERRQVKRLRLVVITSDKGLCGGLNSNVLKMATRIIEANPDKEISLITIGKKAEKYFRGKQNIVAVFDSLGDRVQLAETRPISHMLMRDFVHRDCDEVVAVYTNFVTTLKQDVTIKELLPITEYSFGKTLEEMGSAEEAVPVKNLKDATEYLFEPSPREVLKHLLSRMVETQVYDIILESTASEFSARMVAMKNATDSANDLLADLKLSYNYARQQKITQEMTEIAAGVAALE